MLTVDVHRPDLHREWRGSLDLRRSDSSITA